MIKVKKRGWNINSETTNTRQYKTSSLAHKKVVERNKKMVETWIIKGKKTLSDRGGGITER